MTPGRRVLDITWRLAVLGVLAAVALSLPWGGGPALLALLAVGAALFEDYL